MLRVSVHHNYLALNDPGIGTVIRERHRKGACRTA